MNDLRFYPSRYTVETCTLNGAEITYRVFKGLAYCASPASKIQVLNLFAPECYFDGGAINGYTLHTAPIFMPNTVGGYMQGPAMEPGIDRFNGKPNTAFEALRHGYVVAAAGIRGRNTGEVSHDFFVGSDSGAEQEADGALVGRAPALIVDMKAAIRYLRHNRDLIPGDTERIITNGTSAGGALSALTGATGNSADYAPYLAAIGAAEERDDIFAASCYCPIHNLDHADAAYEWLFGQERSFHRIKFVKTPQGIRMEPESGLLTEKQLEVSKVLKAQFPAYVNSLHLTDPAGNALTLEADGNGSFRDYVKGFVMASAQRELDTGWSKAQGRLMVLGADVEKQGYLTIEDGKVTDLDWAGYVGAITRMKTAPAFDDLGLKSAENEEFGDERVYARHFTKTAMDYSDVPAELADPKLVKLLNPTCYIGAADTCKHWRIRHGAYDRDTAIAIPVILATLLMNQGCDVDFALPWGLPHSGDYDLEELFAWIDGLCRA